MLSTNGVHILVDVLIVDLTSVDLVFQVVSSRMMITTVAT
jgi:hypothetical protein